MLGKPIIKWDATDIAKGMSTSDEMPDGGFAPHTSGQVNPIASPGVLYSPAAPTDVSTSLTGDMAVSAQNGTTGSMDKVFLAIDAATSDGSYYWWNGTALTLKRTDSSNNYVFGRCDIICFDNEFYSTSNEALTRWTADDGTFNVSFFTFNDSTAAHPALVYRNFAFYGDGNRLLRQTAANTVPALLMTLPAGQKITALGIDPGSGKMLISVSSGYNASDTLPTLNFVLYHNGTSAQPEKTVVVDDLVTAFYPVGSTVFLGYGQSLGYWNGSGIEFLRKLNVGYDNAELPYKGHFSNIGSTLYVIERTQILAYGQIRQQSPPVFYNAYKNAANSNNITHISNLGQNFLGVGFKDEKFYKWSTTSVADSNGAEIKTDDYGFDRPYMIRRLKMWFKTSLTDTAASNAGFVQFFANGALSTPPGNNGFIVNTTGAVTYSVEIKNLEFKTETLAMIFSLSSTYNLGLKKFIVYGDPVELP